jgi:hypothetical protein
VHLGAATQLFGELPGCPLRTPRSVVLATRAALGRARSVPVGSGALQLRGRHAPPQLSPWCARATAGCYARAAAGCHPICFTSPASYMLHLTALKVGPDHRQPLLWPRSTPAQQLDPDLFRPSIPDSRAQSARPGSN